MQKYLRTSLLLDAYNALCWLRVVCGRASFLNFANNSFGMWISIKWGSFRDLSLSKKRVSSWKFAGRCRQNDRICAVALKTNPHQAINGTNAQIILQTYVYKIIHRVGLHYFKRTAHRQRCYLFGNYSAAKFAKIILIYQIRNDIDHRLDGNHLFFGPNTKHNWN